MPSRTEGTFFSWIRRARPSTTAVLQSILDTEISPELVPAGEDEVGAVEVEAAARVEAQHLGGRPGRVECGVIGAQFVGAVDVIAREERGHGQTELRHAHHRRLTA